MNVAYLAFNFKSSPNPARKEVRQAIAYAINRQAIVDALYGGTGQVAALADSLKHLVLPAVALSSVPMAIVLLGDGLRDALDPRTR